MNTFLWILQILLALVFLLTSIRKFIRSDAEMRVIPWAKGMEPWMVRGVGILELLGAVGVILPTLTGILPWVAALAAIGLCLTMIGAMVANYRVALYRPIVVNMVLLILAVIVVYGRWTMPL